jgi:HK97 family phage portal protein
MGWISNIIEKLNPAQIDIYNEYGESQPTTQHRKYTVLTAYEHVEVVNRGVNLLVDSAASLTIDIKDRINTLAIDDTYPKPQKLDILFNRKPNPFISALTLKKNLFMDLLIDGNAFIYFDGVWIYQLPAASVEIITDKTTYINHYKYQDKKFFPHEVIHLKDNGARSIFRGDSRLKSCLGSIDSLLAMETYQTKYFQNNTILGLVLKTPNALSQKVKDRYIEIFMQQHNASQGKRPVLLDGDMSIESLGNEKFRELDFQGSTTAQEDQILAAIGVPPILLNSGNNANISPNQKMFYINTVLPLFNILVNELELFFGYDLKTIESEVLALQGEMKDKGNYYSTLVNNGIMTQNEAREQLRLEKSTDAGSDDLIKPANVAGSATDSNSGGAPKKDSSKKE